MKFFSLLFTDSSITTWATGAPLAPGAPFRLTEWAMPWLLNCWTVFHKSPSANSAFNFPNSRLFASVQIDDSIRTFNARNVPKLDIFGNISIDVKWLILVEIGRALRDSAADAAAIRNFHRHPVQPPVFFSIRFPVAGQVAVLTRAVVSSRAIFYKRKIWKIKTIKSDKILIIFRIFQLILTRFKQNDATLVVLSKWYTNDFNKKNCSWRYLISSQTYMPFPVHSSVRYPIFCTCTVLTASAIFRPVTR